MMIANKIKREQTGIDQLQNFIPSTQLNPIRSISKLFLEKGIRTFQDAVLWVYQLPYGRNSNRADYRLIFKELKGTCSTKHAALAALAKEYQLPISLKLTICKLNTTLDPKVKPLLDDLGIDYLPEAHCYLSCPQEDIDVTFPNQPPYPKVEILKDYIISPDDIGHRKVTLHQEFLKCWLEKSQLNRNLSFNELWELREQWIRSL